MNMHIRQLYSVSVCMYEHICSDVIYIYACSSTMYILRDHDSDPFISYKPQERKKKLRDFVNNINAEKASLEDTITTLHSDLSHCREGLSGAIANSSQLEHDKVVLEEEKVKILQQVILYVVYI